MLQKALFRCDGYEFTGFGHLGRCLALAEALEELGWKASFFGCYDDVAKTRIESAGFPYEILSADTGGKDDRALAIQRIHDFGAALIVLDSYKIEPAYAASLKGECSAQLLAIDDFAAWSSYPVDVILNFTLGADSRAYPIGPRLLLGPGYFLVRRDLRKMRSVEAPSTSGPRRICIMLSGDQSGARALAVLRLLADIVPSAEVRLVLPRALEDYRSFEEVINCLGPGSRLIVQAPNLADALHGADLAICTGGLAKYEAAYLGAVPAVVSNGPGEREDTAKWTEATAGFDLGPANDIDEITFMDRLEHVLLFGPITLDAMRIRGQNFFPIDPTLAAAREIVEIVQAAEFAHD
jgi:spore coat polysaccharide biosynthesis predicted glycosyltransferase SpsG